MEPAEERAAELEALEAIFDKDFRIIEEATETSGARFEVQLDDDVEGNVKVRLVFKHTDGYPDEPLQLVVHALDGLSTPLRKQLQLHLEQVAKENVEGVAVYTICEEARDWISQNVVGAPDKEEENVPGRFETTDGTQEDKVEVIASKAIGTPVTVESFAEWRRKFEAEMAAKKTKEQLEKEANQKLTGRQMFESKTVVVSAESESFWEAEASQAAGGD